MPGGHDSIPGGVWSDHPGVVHNRLNDRAIRDAALCFNLSLLKGYRDFLVTPDLNHGSREIFNKNGFLAAADKNNRPFLEKVGTVEIR
jgi:hypothetical protein